MDVGWNVTQSLRWQIAMEEWQSDRTPNVTQGGKIPATHSLHAFTRSCLIEDPSSWTHWKRTPDLLKRALGIRHPRKLKGHWQIVQEE
ncbi:hypothetical protein TNCV_3050801 [Trichonephila clavipes]|nr:hypothetical protein TNCV_3050801 [Trichonephila clavipes]